MGAKHVIQQPAAHVLRQRRSCIYRHANTIQATAHLREATCGIVGPSHHRRKSNLIALAIHKEGDARVGVHLRACIIVLVHEVVHACLPLQQVPPFFV